MPLRLRLILLFATVIILMGLCVEASISLYNSSLKQAEGIRQQTHEQQLRVAEVNTAWLQMLDAWKDVLLQGHLEDEYRVRLKIYYEQERTLRDLVLKLHNNVIASEPLAAEINQFQREFLQVALSHREALTLFNDSSTNAHQIADEYSAHHYFAPDQRLDRIDGLIKQFQSNRVSDINTKIDREVTVIVIAGGAICIIIFGLLLWLTNRAVLHPLKILTRAAEKVAKGERNVLIERKETDKGWSSEFGVLTDSFNHMTSSVDRINHELQVKISELENEVENRRSTEVKLRSLTKDLVGAQEQIKTHADNLEQEVKARTNELWHQANYDSLTQLPNRNLFSDRLNQAIRQAERHNTSVALLYLDLDLFKRINDTMGHEFGDKALIEASKRLKGLVRESDTVARLGGDEFTIILTDIESHSGAVHVADKIRETFETPLKLGENYESHLTTSIGISIFPADARTASGLLKCADVAMYKAKDLGRNNYSFYTWSLGADIQKRSRIEQALLRSDPEIGFNLHFQCIVNSSSHTITGCEALLRWQDSVLGKVGPDEFIHIAEDCGKILDIGRWVLRTACRQQVAWRNEGLGDLRMAINISAVQFAHPTFLDEIRFVLEETGIDPSNLELEITESCIMENAQASVNTLQELKSLGLSLSIDDFGTGYSSLSYLKRFPVDTLKIDRTFVRDIFTDDNDKAICRAVLALAEAMGLNVIAEGIETAEHAEHMRKMGCHELQGYLFGHPEGSDEFSQKISLAT